MKNPGFSRFVEYAPGEKKTNDQLPVFFEKIQERTDIHSRNIASESDTVEGIACHAARELFRQLNIKGNDCGGLVLSSSTGNERPLHQVTDTAKKIAECLGIEGKLKAGVNFACSGFPAAVEKGLEFAGHTDKRIVIITAEIMSRLVDWENEGTAVLFGDRAAATSIMDGGHTILEAKAWDIDDDTNPLFLEKRSALGPHGKMSNRDCISMNGKQLYREAPGIMKELILDSMRRHNLTPADIVAAIPHQANGRFMKKIMEMLLKDSEEWRHLWMVNQIDQMANVGSSSIPSAMAQIQDDLVPGKVVICPAVGAGPDFQPRKLSEGILAFRISEDEQV